MNCNNRGCDFPGQSFLETVIAVSGLIGLGIMSLIMLTILFLIFEVLFSRVV